MKVVHFGPRREPAVLVERFEELREGMIVYVSPCPAPGCSYHRGILIREQEPLATQSVKDGNVAMTGGWEFSPPVHGAQLSILSAIDVAYRAVYAVILEPPAETESSARRKELVTT